MALAYKEKSYQMRQAFIQKADESMKETYNDEFFKKQIEEVKVVTQKQIQYFLKTQS
jgi:ribosomal 30S subunit maturation factor RimM